MEEAIYEGYMNPKGRMSEVFGDQQPTVEELIAYLVQMIEELEV